MQLDKEKKKAKKGDKIKYSDLFKWDTHDKSKFKKLRNRH